MDLAAAGLREQPFKTHGKLLTTVAYASHRDALAMLRTTCDVPNGLALLQGPTLSGKSTLIRRFVDTLPEVSSIAVADGEGLNTTGLLETLLRQFGYELDTNSASELLAMLRVFALQQTASHDSPIVVIENAHALNPSALHALCELAELRVRQFSALKIILVSDRSLRPIIESPAMEAIAKRVFADYHLRPMSCEEATDYIHRKLHAAGSDNPDFVIPMSVCNELWQASGGWPGILDRVSLLALAKAETLPVPISVIERPVLPKGTWDTPAFKREHVESGEPPAPPTLIVSYGGQTQQKLTLDKTRVLIGRSEHNDISIKSRFVSRHHLLLVRNGNATFLMDLNSTNGTFVNTRRVSNHVLIDDDIITMGNHRIKFSDPHAKQRGSLDGMEFADTVIMKTLADMRALLARENTQLMPTPSENVPTIGG